MLRIFLFQLAFQLPDLRGSRFLEGGRRCKERFEIMQLLVRCITFSFEIRDSLSNFCFQVPVTDPGAFEFIANALQFHRQRLIFINHS